MTSQLSPSQQAFLDARWECKSDKDCALKLGLHPGTPWNWKHEYPRFKAAYRERLEAEYEKAIAEAHRRIEAAIEQRWAELEEKRRQRSTRRPSVPWPKVCPDCGGRLLIRRCWSGAPFCFCAARPWPCGFTSWQPPAPGKCAKCGGSRLWSHSRKSVVCRQCGERTAVDWERVRR